MNSAGDAWVREIAVALADKVGGRVVYPPSHHALDAYMVTRAGLMRTGLRIVKQLEDWGQSDGVDISLEDFDRILDQKDIPLTLVVRFNDIIGTVVLHEGLNRAVEDGYAIIPLSEFRKVELKELNLS